MDRQATGTIGWAAEALRNGYRVRRVCWSPTMYLEYTPTSGILLCGIDGKGEWYPFDSDILGEDWERYDA